MDDDAQAQKPSGADKGGRLSPGQLGRANRLSEKALRVYQEKGLLVPRFVDESTGRRYLDIEQSTTLDLICALQQIGLSLDEIVEVNERKDIAHLQEVIDRHREDLERQLRLLTIASSVAADYSAGCSLYLNPPPCDQILLERLPDRHVLRFELPDAGEGGADLSSPTAHGWEGALRYTRQRIVECGYPLVLYRDVGSVVRTEALFDESLPYVRATFVYVDEDFGPCFDDAQVLPGGSHLVLYNMVAYSRDGMGLSRARMRRMVEYAGKKGMVVNGEPFGEALCRWPRLFDEGYTLLHRLCLPVRYPEAP